MADDDGYKIADLDEVAAFAKKREQAYETLDEAARDYHLEFWAKLRHLHPNATPATAMNDEDDTPARTVGEIWQDVEDGWLIKVAEMGLLPDADSDFGGDGIRIEGLSDFGKRNCISRLAIPTPDILTAIDRIASDNPHFSELTGLVRLHASAAVSMTRPVRIPHILLLGEPGVGKTYVVKALASALGLPVTMIDAPSMTGGGVFAGVDKTWKRPRAGKVATGLMTHEVANQVIIVDEIDKVYEMPGYSSALDPLHGLLEPSSAGDWRDECLGTQLDASWLTVIATANSIDEIAPSLLDRFVIIRITKPSREQLGGVIRSIAASCAQDFGEWFSTGPLEDDVIDSLIASDASPRNIRKKLGMAMITAASDGRRLVAKRDIDAVARLSVNVNKARIGFIRS